MYDWPDLIRLGQWPTSAQLRTELAGQTVLLSFSRGKDSIAAWLALRDCGAHVIPYYLYLVGTREPDGTMTAGLRFEQQSLAYFEQAFDTPILRLPHPSLWRYLTNYVYQSPDRAPIIDACQLVPVTYDDVNRIVRDHYALPADTWVVDGVRAADSPNRRTAMLRFGPNNLHRRTFRAVWDWRKAHVMQSITHAGIALPIDYQLWGRSWDGLDARFTAPLAKHLPDDYQTLRRWFPMIGADLHRQQLRARYAPETLRKARV